MLEIKNLHKSYEKNNVLENITVSISKGKIIGIVGSNGAGKTTFLNSIMNKIEFDGEILINRMPNFEFLKTNRDDILFLPDNVFVYPFLTGLEFIKFVLALKKIEFSKEKEKVDLFFNLFNLEEHSDILIKEYSHGMKKKIALISMLVLQPKIFLLDEPVSGLDTVSLIALKKVLTSMSKRGATILFSTHILDFVENLCDSIIVINNKQANIIVGVKSLSKREIESKYLSIVGEVIDEKIDEIENLENY